MYAAASLAMRHCGYRFEGHRQRHGESERPDDAEDDACAPRRAHILRLHRVADDEEPAQTFRQIDSSIKYAYKYVYAVMMYNDLNGRDTDEGKVNDDVYLSRLMAVSVYEDAMKNA